MRVGQISEKTHARQPAGGHGQRFDPCEVVRQHRELRFVLERFAQPIFHRVGSLTTTGKSKGIVETDYLRVQ